MNSRLWPVTIITSPKKSYVGRSANLLHPSSFFKNPAARVRRAGSVSVHAGTLEPGELFFKGQVCAFSITPLPHRLITGHSAQVSHSRRGIWEITDRP